MAGLQVNGQSISFTQGTFPASVGALIEKCGLNRKTVVAEVKGKIVPQTEFDRHPLADGDTVELIQFVGGG